VDKITILLADDHNVLRQGIAQALETQPDMHVIAQASTGTEALARAREYKPMVALLDIQMPEADGIEVARILKAELPEIGIIILTMFKQDNFIIEAIKAGANGYLLKEVELDEMLEAIRRVARGEAVLDPVIAGRVLAELRQPSRQEEKLPQYGLAERDLQILTEIGRGLSNQEIAEKLIISEKTVRNRLSGIFKQFNLKNRTEAALYALKIGLVRLDADE
jgi:two-component system, NarL family, response regulator LiaR